jgi:hypothetical protein
MFKNAVTGKQVTEFVGLPTKCYAFTVDGVDSKKCKGTKKIVVKKRLTIIDSVRTIMIINLNY